MKRSNDRVTNMILNYIGSDNLKTIDAYSNEKAIQNFISIKDFDSLKKFFDTDELYDSISNEEVELVRYYTGVSYREINAILRNNWNYEINGKLTEEKEIEYRKIGADISNAIDRTPPLKDNLTTYRGVSLTAFKRYGAETLEDLLSLKGEYYYERGFTSTSIVREASFFNRPLEWHSECNIEIKFLISKGSNEGIPLLDTNTSYSHNESEYLINKDSLSKIVEVKLSEDKTKAYVTMILLPKKIWNRDFQKENKATYTK